MECRPKRRKTIVVLKASVVTVAVENSVTVMYEANRRRCSQDSVGAIVDLVVGVTNTER